MAEQSVMATPIFDELVAELNQDATFADRLDALQDEESGEAPR
jgi:hypothetical protein